MRFERSLVEGRFIRRLNRFSVLVGLEGREVTAHLANSGRLGELLVEGRTAYLLPREGAHRKTAYDLAIMRTESGVYVSMDARLPNRLFTEFLSESTALPFSDYPTAHSEVTVGRSRIDFVLRGKDGRFFIEVKSVTLIRERVGFFPDGPTARGARHLRELMEIRKRGERAGVVFVVQRSDVECIMPNDDTDPYFGEVLREAVSQGVEAFGCRCRVGPEGVWIEDAVPVVLEKHGK